MGRGMQELELAQPPPTRLVVCPLRGYETWKAIVLVDVSTGTLLAIQEAGLAFQGMDPRAEPHKWAEAMGVVDRTLSECVVGWNFCDPLGEALPQPFRQPDAFLQVALSVKMWLLEEATPRVQREEREKKVPPLRPTSGGKGRRRPTISDTVSASTPEAGAGTN